MLHYTDIQIQQACNTYCDNGFLILDRVFFQGRDLSTVYTSRRKPKQLYFLININFISLGSQLTFLKVKERISK